MKLQGKTIYETDTRDYNYKYLGIPITNDGMNATQYFKKVKNRFYATLNEIITCADNNQLNLYNKLTLYKTVVRAHIDYGAPVISYTKSEMDKLEKDQIKAIKRLLKLNYYTTDETVLAITKLTTIRHRMATLKTKFRLKLIQQEDTTWSQHKQRSLATKVFNEIRTGFAIRTQHTKRLPPNVEMYNTLIHYDLKDYIKFDSELNYQTLDKRIKSHFTDKQNTTLIQTDKTRCKKTW